MHVVQEQLIICGGGHVSQALIRIGKILDFQVTVIEDRPLFAGQAKEAGADRVICNSFLAALAQEPGSEETYFVIVTRGHRFDMDCLRAILSKEYAYAGMMGSKGRVHRIKEQLLAEGCPPGKIDGLHSPIGLDIGAVTPEEIAVSVGAELIAVRSTIKNRNVNQTEDNRGFTQEIKEAALEESDVPRVLATIVSRKGSAPRSVGTRMVIFADGRCRGTIGGGCMEAQVIRKAIDEMRTRIEADEPLLLEVRMLPEEAEEGGMACGGVVEVELEEIK